MTLRTTPYFLAALLATLALWTDCASTQSPLFPSRVPLAPLLEKLKAAGGDPQKAFRVHGEEDLAGLKPGRKYKYVVRADGQLVIAPRPADEPGNEYVHPILGKGEPVRTAGYLRFERRGASTNEDMVTVDQDSKAYCPSFQSLGEARSALGRVGFGRERVRFEDHPAACVAPPIPDAGQGD